MVRWWSNHPLLQYNREDTGTQTKYDRKMPRLHIILAPLAIFTCFTMIILTHKINPGENNKRYDDNEYSHLDMDYMTGMGPPPIVIESASRRGGGGGPPPPWLSKKDSLPDAAEVAPEEEEAEITSDEDEEEKDSDERMEGDEEDDDDIFLQDDDENNLRPRKRPKGKRWKGYRHKQQQQHATNTWWRKSPLCFEVDNLCHGKEKNKWFYYTPPSSQQKNNGVQDNGEHEANLIQPTMELKSAPAKYDGGKDQGDKRISIRVASTSKLKPEDIIFEEDNGGFVKKSGSTSNGNNGKCQISPTPTHVVLQSLFNDMIGEFYARTLLRLYRFMIDGADANNTKNKLPWEEDIQFYVHIPYSNKKMLDGHRLLLSGMLSNPESPSPKSLVDLFVQDEAVDDNNSGEGDCQCYQKMVFCGYDIYTHPSNLLSKDLESATDDDDDANDDDDAAQNSESSDNVQENKIDLKHTLWSAGKLDKGVDFDMGSCGRATGGTGTEYDCKEWAGLKAFLSTNFLKHCPTLESDIEKRRRDQLLEKGAIDESYQGNTKEFTVIGLTQRTYRRSWINLPDIMKECNAVPFERAICVEVNVENTASPYEQLLLHRSLDVMIGVHGAQLTQAILLPKHAHVLELLPWVPSYIR